MKALARGAGWFDRSMHGVKSSRPYFRGALLRQVFGTLHDRESGQSTRAWLYLCQHNVLVFAQEVAGESGVVMEVEPADAVEVRLIDDAALAGILGATPGTEHNLAVHTSHQACVVDLTQRYSFLCGIQTDLAYGSSVMNRKTTYMNGADDVEKTRRLVEIVHAVQRGEAGRPTGPLPGLGPGLMRTNYVLMAITVVVCVLFVAWTLLRSR